MDSTLLDRLADSADLERLPGAADSPAMLTGVAKPRSRAVVLAGMGSAFEWLRTTPDGTRMETVERDCAAQGVPLVELLDHLDLAVVGLHSTSRAVFYENRFAGQILGDNRSQWSAELLELLESTLADPARAARGAQRIWRRQGRILGYSISSRAPDSHWLLLRDITEQMQLQQIAETTELMHSLGYVFSGLSHEIGNPLNSLKVTMCVLRNGMDTFSREKVLEYIDRALQETSRIEYLLRCLKGFNAYEEVEPRCVDLAIFLDSFLRLVRDEAKNRAIALHWSPGATRLWVRADPRALHQVLLNLVTNSMQALQGRSHPCLVLMAAKTLDRLQLCVEDNGCGIHPEALKTLFLPFHTTKAQGTGLGLCMVRKLLAKMEGTVEVRSEQNVGTQVIITLPAARDEDCDAR